MWFIFVFFAIYAAMHSYFFWKVCVAFPHLGYYRLLLGGVLVLMLLAPLLVRLLDGWGYFRLAGALGVVGYLWLAALFWFFILLLAADVWNLTARGVVLALPAARRAMLPARPTFLVFAGLVVAGLGWGWIEASNIRIREITVPVRGLPPGRESLTLVQVSDLHLGLHTGARRLRRVVRLIEQADPDILVSTGDLVDSPIARTRPLADLLREVKAPLGKFAVLGNHEYHAGLSDSVAFHEAAGFRLLRQEAHRLGPGLLIAGVDDPAGHRRGQACFTDEDAVLPAKGAPPATILLKHRPIIRPESLGRFDLQLSGHTHGGQIFPFHFVLFWQYGFRPGLHKLSEGSWLYLSPGTGTWGPPLRVFAAPEVTVITLRCSAK